MISSHLKFPPLIILIALFIATPAYSDPFPGTFSTGIGGGMGDEEVGPGVLSVKYWDRSWEVGCEVFYDGKDDDDSDQFGLLWGSWRVDLHPEERNYLYSGIGFGYIKEAQVYKDDKGPVISIGWDGKEYGLQFKYGYFKRSLYSIVAYYHF